MSGFLQRLVARHGSAPAIRPRPVSRFELGPVAPGGEPGAIGPSGAEGYAVTAWRVMPVAAADRSIAARATLDPDAMTVDRVHGATALAASAATRDGHGEPADPPDSRAPGRAADGGPADALGDRAVSAGPVDPLTAHRALPDAATSRSRPAGEAREPLAGPVPVAARATSMDRSQRERSARRPATREPDVVQVHIGRIDVRAIVAAPERAGPATPRPEPARPLSLERYLSRGTDA